MGDGISDAYRAQAHFTSDLEKRRKLETENKQVKEYIQLTKHLRQWGARDDPLIPNKRLIMKILGDYLEDG